MKAISINVLKQDCENISKEIIIFSENIYNVFINKIKDISSHSTELGYFYIYIYIYLLLKFHAIPTFVITFFFVLINGIEFLVCLRMDDRDLRGVTLPTYKTLFSSNAF